MKGNGNFRSLWMGVLWALPSGTGVAVALLQGSNGPLIGVAISASLLPPVVNCKYVVLALLRWYTSKLRYITPCALHALGFVYLIGFGTIANV
ncbi:hypothetical protein TSAR_008459 [Trichomalopsis sarcophagae]|uniref:Uncharacterized protein n=1 Tax=Trichomalopsis sarcophagae TaxID=543379 RepID=A0A232FAH8_9HYME|nr:hypothetical protein TSAR_008459 [Trichomalopsis sarcophagae]